MATGYHISKFISADFDVAVERVTHELQNEGFGIVTEIDLKTTFKEKLNKDFRNYKILGACNPALAYDAIHVEDHIGIMLPCNILVQQHEDGRVEISAVDPRQSIGVVGNPQLNFLAEHATEKLKSVINRL